MRLLVLSLLAVCSLAHSYTVSYPYRSDLLRYAPARGEFPVYNTVSQGYIRYLDSNGAERLVGYNYPEPLYGYRRLSYSSEGKFAPVVKTGTSGQEYYLQDSTDLEKAREEHFKEWCAQRYQALKAEVEKLRAQGKVPSADIMSQLVPLEKIVRGISYVAISETPELQRTREEHLRIWNEARVKVLQQQADQTKQQLQGGIAVPISVGLRSQPVVEAVPAPIFETPEQKKAREEHNRIYNEQLLRVQKLEAQQIQDTKQKAGEVLLKEAPHSQQSGVKIIEEHIVTETPEVTRAKEEHLRVWQEAKSRAEKEGYKYEPENIGVRQSFEEEEKKVSYDAAAKSVFKTYTSTSAAVESGIQSQQQQQPISPVEDTPEVKRAREEHLKLKAQVEESQQQFGASTQTPVLFKTAPGVQPTNAASVPVFKSSLPASGSYVQQPGAIEDTPEVKRAREEHLKIVNEAQLKAAQGEIFQTDRAIIYSTIEDSDKIKDIREENREIQLERLRETERQREEETIRQAERLREQERLKEEQRLMEVERLRLKQEEEQRIESERLVELKRLSDEQQSQKEQEKFSTEHQQSADAQQFVGQFKTVVPVTQTRFGGGQFVLTEQQKTNPFFVRYASQASEGGAGNYILAEQKPAQPSISKFYLPAAGATTGVIGLQEPLVIQYGPESRPQLLTERIDTTNLQTIENRPTILEKIPAGSTFGMKINYGEGSNLSELERATREHFRAHEVALEQLRLANSLNADYRQDCN